MGLHGAPGTYLEYLMSGFLRINLVDAYDKD